MSGHRGLIAVFGMWALAAGGSGCGRSASPSGRAADAGAPSGTGGQTSDAGGGAGAGGTTTGDGGVTSQAPGGCAPVAADLPATPICENGACWVNPRPSGTFWRTVHGSSASNVWIGGVGTTSLHFDGQRFQAVQNGLSETDAYWAFSPIDVWAGFNGTLLHGDGATFAPTALPPGVSSAGFDFWGAAPNDLYTGGIPLLHWNGNAWASVPQVAVAFFVTGSGSRDVWAGDRDHLFHFDGTTWTAVALPTASFFTVGIASAGPGQLWLLNLSEGTHTIFKYTGTGWSQSLVIPPDQRIFLDGLASAGTDEVVAFGSQYPSAALPAHAYATRFNGASWTDLGLSQPGGVRAAWIDATGTGYLVGDDGTLLHLSATGVDRDITEGPLANFTGVWGRAADDVWLVDDGGGSYRYDGCAINLVPTGTTTPLADVWGAGPRDVWAVGAAGVVIHNDGVAWNAVASGTGADLHAVWAATPDDVWVGGGRNTLLRITPTGVTPVAIPGAAAAPEETIVNDISGSSAADVWIATSSAIVRFDGSTWSAPMVLPPGGPAASITRIWVYAPNDVWAVANTGPRTNPFFHFDGTTWTPVDAPVPPRGRVVFPPPLLTTGINNSFAFDANNHILWVGTGGAFLRSE